ncbi:CheR family methyltransferase [Hydrogenivirga sp. 128-5-R1-1]|uniref:CheR family methyltransferase n=1 Tax=Hydrogenivirga sp. 128-5-R1-1 TaxID=392423 RepID=UPI00015F09E8|nr:CheR family methyltransferase [Hydrogenivirga sp. 128-5-R1-1]EDP73731.1 Methylase of chemotaxis methyl-accepting protein [Hydrogenivirga sp. 128-5-R1-1]
MDLKLEKLKRLRDYISSKYGIYIDNDKLVSIYNKKFQKLMEKYGYNNFEQFYKDFIFRKNSYLIEDVLSNITVNETYFFREEYQFEVLVNNILPDLNDRKDRNSSINILSAPSSTGEEVYSIAIYIMEEGNMVHERDFMLLGIDIDSKAVEKAKAGIYTERSVYKVPPIILQKYFIKTGKYYKVKDFLRQAVNFKVVNVLDKYSMKKLGKFDVIFSRNMLIYFEEKSRLEVLTNFYSILNDNGYLFLGHAERIPNNFPLFRQEKINGVFVYRKNG